MRVFTVILIISVVSVSLAAPVPKVGQQKRASPKLTSPNVVSPNPQTVVGVQRPVPVNTSPRRVSTARISAVPSRSSSAVAPEPVEPEVVEPEFIEPEVEERAYEEHPIEEAAPHDDGETFYELYGNSYRGQCRQWLTKWRRNFWYMDFAHENILYDACSAWYAAEKAAAVNPEEHPLPDSVYGQTELTQLSPEDTGCVRDLYITLSTSPNYESAFEEQQVHTYSAFMHCISPGAIDSVRRVQRIVHSIEIYMAQHMIDCFATKVHPVEQCAGIKTLIGTFPDALATSKKILERLEYRYSQIAAHVE